MFYLEYDEVLSILATMSGILGQIDTAIDNFSVATYAYNITMQDATATEATQIVHALRNEIIEMKELIEKGGKIAYEGACGLKGIEDHVSNGGLKV